MKKSIVFSIAIIFASVFITNAFAQAPKKVVGNAKVIETQPTKNTAGITVTSKKNGVSIIVLEANGGCGLASLAGMTTFEQFLKSPNTAKSNEYKGLDASVADCCARSTDGTFLLRISFVDCNGNAIASRRPYEAVTKCSATSKELTQTIARATGAPAAGTTQYLKNIKVWQE